MVEEVIIVNQIATFTITNEIPDLEDIYQHLCTNYKPFCTVKLSRKPCCLFITMKFTTVLLYKTGKCIILGAQNTEQLLIDSNALIDFIKSMQTYSQIEMGHFFLREIVYSITHTQKI